MLFVPSNADHSSPGRKSRIPLRRGLQHISETAAPGYQIEDVGDGELELFSIIWPEAPVKAAPPDPSRPTSMTHAAGLRSYLLNVFVPVSEDSEAQKTLQASSATVEGNRLVCRVVYRGKEHSSTWDISTRPARLVQ